MKRTWWTWIPALLVAGALPAAAAPVRHDLRVELVPATGTVRVEAVVTLPDDPDERPGELLLNAAFEVLGSEPPLRPAELGEVDGFYGINAGSETAARVELRRWRLDSIPEDGRLSLTYAGRIDYGLSDQKEEYTRGFRETAGTVSEEGVYLAGGSFWYPRFGKGLVEFAVEVTQPEGWHVIAQGSGTSRDTDGRARWESQGPADEIYLVGGPLEVYSEPAGAVEALVYLHERDDALANKYLTATARYIEMYRSLIGPYPYAKFALVENFWETGYGMPSFTLLGPTIIRFPFILTSSYPHEVLHNWWGNSVFVDYESGNWCEGLTAYLADHLLKEQRGQGAGYRRDSLQKYRNYVGDGEDFPLTAFRSRHDSATEAVGYGKTLMLFHMLRLRLGDEAFARGLAGLYRSFRGKQASFDDVRTSFERAAEQELGRFFEQWTTRTGAPSLGVAGVEVVPADGGFAVRGTLRQIRGGEPFVVDVPVAVQTEEAVETASVRMDGASAAFEIPVAGRPQTLVVDPLFDVFRLLDPREVPPSIGQVYGEPRILAVLPSADEEETAAYRELVEGWISDDHEIEIVLDRDVETLPADRAAWLLGRDNRLARRLFAEAAPENLKVGAAHVDLGAERAELAGHSIVAVRRHPASPERAVGWIAVDPAAAFPGMGRKLPHYGKYSYLAFEGDEPVNVIKGQWPATASPLRVDLRPVAERGAPVEAAAFAKREPLAELPAVFSLKALTEHVDWMAAPEREGRGAGSEGAKAAADYIARGFEAAGLRPGGDGGSWYQTFTLPDGPDGEPVEAVNVIGVLPGTKPDWSEQSVVIGAHYDHLGRGWPDVHQGDEGSVHPGADDNASGVAVLLELAKSVAAEGQLSRNVVFAAFAAEEAGRAGSKHFVTNTGGLPASGIRGVINLDTVGRLGDGPVSVLGTGTADEWQHIFRGCSFVTGVDSKNVPGSMEGSDQMSFIEQGIPGVQIFTKAHEDYHRPTDTADKVDGPGLVKIATFVKEALVYMGEREEPLTVTIQPTGGIAVSGGVNAKVTGSRARRVRFGSVPDFAFQGPGVKLSGVTPGSPAEKAGLREGDVILRIDDSEIADLRAFSTTLRGLEPGQQIVAVIERGGETLEVPVTVESR
jgi:hypothetical protein